MQLTSYYSKSPMNIKSYYRKRKQSSAPRTVSVKWSTFHSANKSEKSQKSSQMK